MLYEHIKSYMDAMPDHSVRSIRITNSLDLEFIRLVIGLNMDTMRTVNNDNNIQTQSASTPPEYIYDFGGMYESWEDLFIDTYMAAWYLGAVDMSYTRNAADRLLPRGDDNWGYIASICGCQTYSIKLNNKEQNLSRHKLNRELFTKLISEGILTLLFKPSYRIGEAFIRDVQKRYKDNTINNDGLRTIHPPKLHGSNMLTYKDIMDESFLKNADSAGYYYKFSGGLAKGLVNELN